MAEAYEDPTESVREEIHHKAEETRERWVMVVALSSAILAALAAVTALLAGHHANEAMIEQIQASDQWAYYQAKGIKDAVLETRISLGQALHQPASPEELKKHSQYQSQQQEIFKVATEKETSSRSHLRHHVILARGVTMFQVAIAVAAIAILIRKRRFWAVSLVFGLLGLFFLIHGLLPTSP